ncbi:hypothetical protein CS542_08230 [Pedobacter sp. IW39]|nr:hypothetical protein CS542_08230 [Pedobacter sp. IW39]
MMVNDPFHKLSFIYQIIKKEKTSSATEPIASIMTKTTISGFQRERTGRAISRQAHQALSAPSAVNQKD